MEKWDTSTKRVSGSGPFGNKLTALGTALCLLGCLLPSISHGQLLEVNQGEKWGFMNPQGKLLIPPQYDYIYPSAHALREQGYFVIRQGTQQGVLQLESGAILPPTYDSVRLWIDETKTVWMQCFQDSLFGMANAAGEAVISSVCDSLAPPMGPWWPVKSGDRWGMVGPAVHPPQFDSLRLLPHHFLTARAAHQWWCWRPDGQEIVSGQPWNIALLADSLLSYEVDGKKGLLDREGQPLCEPIFRDIWRNQGLLLAAQSGWGVIDRQGTFIIPPRYQQLRPDGERIWMRQNNRWGLLSREGDVLLKPQLRWRGRFNQRVAVVFRGQKAGLINDRGQWLARPEYDDMELYPGTARARRNGRWTLIPFDSLGNPTNRKRILVRGSARRDNWLANLSADDPRNFGWVYHVRSGRWGLRDSTRSRWLIPPRFEEVYCIPGREVSVVVMDLSTRDRDQRTGPRQPNIDAGDRLCGLVNHRTGKLVTPFRFHTIFVDDFRTGLVARAQYKNGQFVLLRTDGKVRGEQGTGYIGPFRNGRAVISMNSRGRAPLASSLWNAVSVDQRDIGGKWGIVTDKGTWGIRPTFDYLRPYSNGLAMIQLNGLWGAIDTNYQQVVPPSFDGLEALNPTQGQQSLLRTRKNHLQYHVLDQHGTYVFSQEATEMGYFSEGLASFKQDERWGFVDSLGKVVVPPRFLSVRPFREGLAAVFDGRYWGYVNSQGQLEIACQYNRAGHFSQGMAHVVNQHKRHGVIDPKGNWLILPEYHQASEPYGGLVIVRKKRRRFLLNREGEKVIRGRMSNIERRGDYYRVVKGRKKVGLHGPKGEQILPPRYRRNKSIRFNRDGSVEARNQQTWETILPAGTLPSRMNAGQRSLKATIAQRPRDEQVLYADITERFGYSLDQHLLTGGRIVVRSHAVYGLLDRDGNEILPPSFERIRYIQGLYQVVKRGAIGYLHPDGTWVYRPQP